MATIRFAEISGLYSYNSKKNRIDFGKNTLIVGPNNAGKSSIFKALKFFLNSLTEFNKMNQRPWDLQDIHEMAVGLTLDDAERGYVAESLSIIGPNESGPFALAPHGTAKWLADKLCDIKLTIRWDDTPFRHAPDQIKYFLRLEDLGVTIYSSGYNRDAWAAEHPKPDFQHKPNSKSFSETIESAIKNDPTKEEISTLFQQGVRISQFPDVASLVDAPLHGTPTRDNRDRVEFVRRLSGNRTPRNTTRSFFIMLGRMLEQKFTFISEQRRFSESNDLEKLPLKDDGSNLHSFLFWLKNGDGDRQATYSAIQNKFKNVLGRQRLSFNVSIIEREEQQEQHTLDPPRGKIYPDRVAALFAETDGERQKTTNFTSVGAGTRETLFLLTRCFDRQGRIILVDEPATNLHPTQIRRLMGEILAPGGPDGESGQVVFITHSPSIANLELLSSVNKIVRVDREAHSRIVQPSGEDKEWIEKNLATFHLLKSDVLFAKKVVLVEGPSDKIFLEAILRHSTELDLSGDDIVVLDVGGSGALKKFRKFLEIFEIPFVILADSDARDQFGSDEVLEINPKSISLEDDGSDKTIFLLEKDLEGCLADLEPGLYKKITDEYRTKPERAYHFTRQLAKDGPDGAWGNLIRCLARWIAKSHDSVDR